MNGIEDDVRSVSSDNDNERVREKLKKTTIAPSSRPGSGAKRADEQEDEVMASTPSPTATAAGGTVATEDRQRVTRKRSHDESDEDQEEVGNGRRRLKAHERKRSRDISEEDMMRAGSGLERVKTPPTHPEEETGGISERVSSPRGGLERKRSLGKLDKEGEDEDQKSKISKTEEERRKKGESEVADDKMPETGKEKEEKAGTKVSCLPFRLYRFMHANDATFVCSCPTIAVSQTPLLNLHLPLLLAPVLTSSDLTQARRIYSQAQSLVHSRDPRLLRSERWGQSRALRVPLEHSERKLQRRGSAPVLLLGLHLVALRLVAPCLDLGQL